jgi:hypothetical protein
MEPVALQLRQPQLLGYFHCWCCCGQVLLVDKYEDGFLVEVLLLQGLMQDLTALLKAATISSIYNIHHSMHLSKV